MQTPWIEHRMSTIRWLCFTAWLHVDLIRPLPVPGLPPQQWKHLPLEAVRQMAEAAGPWLLLVLAARQRRGLGWSEATDAPLLAADLAARPCEAGEVPRQEGWLLWKLEGEVSRLVRLTEAPERLLPMGAEMSSEVRYRALAIALMRVYRLYAALAERQEQSAAEAHLCAAAARVRQRLTDTAPAAA